MIEIQKCNIENLKEILILENKYFRSDKWSEKILLDTFNNNFDNIFILKDNKNIEKFIGYYVVRIIQDDAEILKICVNEEFRRNHFGETLINHLINYCINNNVKRIFLDVRKENYPAIGLYKKMEFIKISERKNYYKEPLCDAIIMERSLNA